MKKLVLYTLLFSLTVFSCGNKGENDPKTSQTETPAKQKDAVRIAVMPTIDALPLFLANERGWIEGGEKLDVVKYAAHMDIDTALVRGAVDGAFTDIFRTEYMKKKDGAKFTYLATTQLRWSLVSSHASRLNRLEQFGDKMIATTRFSATDYLTDETFREVKTTAPYFKVQINDINVRLSMLRNNDIDAMWLPEPYATLAQTEGNRCVVKPKKNAPCYGVFALREQFAKNAKNVTMLEAMKKGYNQACDSLNKYGLKAYAAEIQGLCGVDTAVVNRLPQMLFVHCEQPDEKVMTTVNDYLK